MHFIARLVHDLGRHLDPLGRVLQDLQVLLVDRLSVGQDELDVYDVVEIRVLALDPRLAGVHGESPGDSATGSVDLGTVADNLRKRSWKQNTNRANRWKNFVHLRLPSITVDAFLVIFWP